MAEGQDKILESGSDSILFAHKAFKFLENQQSEEALSICEEGVKRFPFYAEGHFILGKCYQTLKKYDDAKNEYERTLVFMPGHIRALSALAFIYYKMDLAPKAAALLIQAYLSNPFNLDLIGYLKSENLYNSIYPAAEIAELPADEAAARQMSEQSDPDIDIEDDVTKELISEINGIGPESSHDNTDIPAQEWSEEAEEDEADKLTAYEMDEDELDHSGMQLDDSEISELGIDEMNGHKEDDADELEFNIDSNKAAGESINIIESELNDMNEDDLNGLDSDHFSIEDSAIDDSFMDDSFISDNAGDEFYLETEETGNQDEDDDEITKIDEFASSKDEHTELSIDQYEVNNIVDNIIEADSLEETKTDLSKFANTEDDFSSLMNGIFEEREPEENDDEFSDDDLDEFDEDETQLAEERPILDTSIIFMDREKTESSKTEDAENQFADTEDHMDLQDTNIQLDLEENADLTMEDDEEDIGLGEIDISDEGMHENESGDDDISKMIQEIEKKGDHIISPQVSEQDGTELYDQLRVEALPAIENENANIDEILSNPKMLTPTFGEILIAQKKFSDAQRVFKELLKKDPENKNFNRKIDFLDKLVKLKK
ncbi:MAG: hypothetical protein JW956_05195 [Calditrichaceae bacterium]|nr:hypothetical protein [Calditrichaceae bacterium]